MPVQFQVPQNVLAEILAIVKPFVSKDQVRQALMCAWFVPKDGYYTVYASDSYKLIALDTEIPAPVDSTTNIGIEAAWLQATIKTMAKVTPIQITASDTEVAVSDFNVTSTGRVCQSEMPNFADLIPKESVGVEPGAFNPKMMKEMMAALAARKSDSPVSIWQMHPTKPLIIKLEGPNRQHLTGWALLMPVRL